MVQSQPLERQIGRLHQPGRFERMRPPPSIMLQPSSISIVPQKTKPKRTNELTPLYPITLFIISRQSIFLLFSIGHSHLSLFNIVFLPTCSLFSV